MSDEPKPPEDEAAEDAAAEDAAAEDTPPPEAEAESGSADEAAAPEPSPEPAPVAPVGQDSPAPEPAEPAPAPVKAEAPERPVVLEPGPARIEGEGGEDLAQQSLNRAVGASFGLLRGLMLLVLLLMLAEGVQTVEEGTLAVKQRFGRYVEDEAGQPVIYEADSRFVFVWPYPIEKLEVVPLRTETLVLEDAFWPVVDAAAAIAEDAALPAQSALTPGKDGYNLTGDRNIVHSRWTIEYRVADPIAWLQAAAAVKGASPGEVVGELLRRAAVGAVLRSVAGASVDDVLTGDISARVQAELQRALGGLELGVEVTAVSARGVYPPGKTQASFNEVTGALSRKKTLESEAESAASRSKALAEAEGRRVELEAQVAQRRRVEQAKADASSLAALLEKFPNNPEGLRVYLSQRRQDVLRTLAADANLYTVPAGQSGVMTIGPAPEELEKERR